MHMTVKVLKTLDYLSEPHTLHEIAAHCRDNYEATKARCKRLWEDGFLDRHEIPGAPGNKASRIKYVIGAGERKPRARTPEEQARLEARRVGRWERDELRSKEPKHGGRVVMLTDTQRWAWGGQVAQGYGPRFSAAILGES